MRVKVYEQFIDEEGAFGKKGEVINRTHEMWSIDAREAASNGKGRFSLQPFTKETKSKQDDKKS